MAVQRPTYEKTSLGYFIGKLAKKSKVRKELDPKPIEELKKIESNLYIEAPKEIEQDKKPEHVDEPK